MMHYIASFRTSNSNWVFPEMRCIFCKQTSDDSRSTEHILPESLGNRSHTLPPGIVCDGCNNYFARKIEKPVLDTGHFRSLRFQQAIPNKKGNVPTQKAILRPNVIVELVREEDGSTVVRVPTEHWDSVTSMGAGELMFPTDRPRPDDHSMSRFLAKVALEAMALQLLAANHPLDPMIDESQLDPLRDWARRGSSGQHWLFHQRVIYDANHKHTDESGQSFQCLNEFDFFGTEQGELYFCLAVFGVEYTLNVAGSALDGYSEWLQQHDQASPLYTPKRI